MFYANGPFSPGRVDVRRMSDQVLSFYESLADHYYLIVENWEWSIQHQAKILGQ